MKKKKGLGLILVLIVMALVFAALPVLAKDRKQAAKHEGEERVLIVGVQAEFQAPFVEFLVNSQITYRFDSKTRTFYVKRDPIPVLEAAKRYEVLNLIAQRGLWEREIERKFKEKWPEVEDPRVCVSLPTYLPDKKKDDSEPIAFILAQGLSKKEVQKVKELVASEVPGLPIRNISVVGTNWRPGPSYEPGSKRIASVR